MISLGRGNRINYPGKVVDSWGWKQEGSNEGRRRKKILGDRTDLCGWIVAEDGGGVGGMNP